MAKNGSQSDKGLLDSKQLESDGLPKDTIGQSLPGTMLLTEKQPSLHEELFGKDPTTNRIILLEQSHLDFGFCNA